VIVAQDEEEIGDRSALLVTVLVIATAPGAVLVATDVSLLGRLLVERLVPPASPLPLESAGDAEQDQAEAAPAHRGRGDPGQPFDAMPGARPG
jgi:hypothetical protein